MRKNSYFVIMLVMFVLMTNSNNLLSQVPKMMSYQGNLLDKNSVPLNGIIQMTFKLFEIPTGGVEIWSETQNVKVDSGFFSIYLGIKNPIENVLFNGQYYLEVTVSGNQVPYDRVPLVTSPYAFRAIYTDTSSVALKALSVADGSISLNSLSNSVKTLGGDLIGILPNPRIKASAILDAIPNNSITQDKLSPNIFFKPSGAASGDLTGTYPDPVIAEGAIKTDRIFDGAVNSQKIKDRTIINLDLNLDALNGTIPFTSILAITGNFKDVNSTNLTTGVSSSSISTNSPIGNLTTLNSTTGNITTINNSFSNITNANIENETVGTSSATISYNAPLANIKTLNSTNNFTSTANISNLTVGASTSTISLSSPQANFTNANISNLTFGVASATTSISAPIANINVANVNTLNASVFSATTSISTPSGFVSNLTVGTISSTVTNLSGINASGTITSGQGVVVTNGGANITGNTTVNGVYLVNGSSTFNGFVENMNTVTNTGQIVNNNTVTSNADVLNKGNTIIGDAGSDGLTVNASTTFNQNPRFSVGLNGINANLNTLTTGTSSATTSLTTPLAIINDASINNSSSNVLTTGTGSATISFTSPSITATDIFVRTIHETTPLAVSNANFTSSVNAPTLTTTTGNITTLNFGTATGTTSLTAPTITASTIVNTKVLGVTGLATINDLSITGSMSTSGTLTTGAGLVVNGGGASIVGSLVVSSGTLTAGKGISVTTGGLNVSAGSLTVTENYISNSGSITLNNGGVIAKSGTFTTLSVGNMPYLAATSSSFGSTTIGGGNNGLYINATLVGTSTALNASINGTTALKVSDDGTTGRVVNVNSALTLSSTNLGGDFNLTAINIRNISIALVSGSNTPISLPTLTSNENGKILYLIAYNNNLVISALGGNEIITPNSGSSFMYIHGNGWYKIN
ncbi:MAG: hypothetical protein NTW25_04995 [Candidatus Kapabacteria bacterium]|nr:hypothetical protein [Candidatus Kapabacteria bacterium]